MEYTALYRKFRPKTFEEVVGQEHITKTLKNQIISGRVGHAYIFTGGRGTGKTSSAKIFARAINCLNSKDGEPCNECEICKANLNGSLTDVVEMDAASNNSVEDIRQIREEVNFLPTTAKYRVYIIDEVHMLSPGAFNALLKTLEEPPEHVKFILATTEPQKLPATILSRCQRFDFKKISTENISKRLEIICKKIDVKITKEALNLIAVLSEGAMRDAISILERCIQEGNDINENQIKELVGIPKMEHINRITENIIDYDSENALTTIEEVVNEGKDLNNYLWEIIKYLRDILIYKTSGKLDIYGKDEIQKIENLSKNVSKERLLNLIYQLSNLQNDMKWSSQKLIIFQTGILKLCTVIDTRSLEERVSAIEKLIENGKLVKNEPVIKQEKKTSIKKSVDIQNENKNLKKPEIVKQNSTENANVEKLDSWSNVLEGLKTSGKITIYTNLLNTQAQIINGNTIEISFKNGMTAFGKKVLTKPENIDIIKNLLIKETGKEMQIKFMDETNKEKQTNDNGILGDLGIPINIID